PYSNYVQPPQTIIIFAPPAAPVYATDEIVTPQQRSSRQKFSRSQSRVPPNMLAAESNLQQGPALYLFALKNGVIRPALDYWVEGRILHYIDLDRAEKDILLDRVDCVRSVQLNRQRGVALHLSTDWSPLPAEASTLACSA